MAKSKEATKEVKSKAKPKKAKAEAAPEPVVPKKKSNGLRTAVKFGEVTAKEALEDLRKKGVDESAPIMRWLKRRSSKPVQAPVEAEEEGTEE